MNAGYNLILSIIFEICAAIFSAKIFKISNDRTGFTRSAVFLIFFIVVHAVGNLYVFKVSVWRASLCVFSFVFVVHLLNVFCRKKLFVIHRDLPISTERLFLRSFVLDGLWIPGKHSRGMCC